MRLRAAEKRGRVCISSARQERSEVELHLQLHARGETMKFNIRLLWILALVLLGAATTAISKQNNDPSTTPSHSDRPAGEIPKTEISNQSERERNLGTQSPTTSQDPNRGEITGAPLPGTVPERVIETGPSWGLFIGGLIVGGIAGLLIGRAWPVRTAPSSRDRAA